MNSTTLPYVLAFASNIFFGSASIIFSRFARSHSPAWINQIKASIALIGFVIAFLIFESYVAQPYTGTLSLMLSGFIGLCIGDLFLFRAFATLGAARTLVLYSFQPLLLGVYGYFFLKQSLNLAQAFSILLMIACVLTFILERNRTTGKWDLLSFFFAFLGIFLDACGVMLSRQAYEVTPSLGSFQVNATRALGALIGFFIIQPQSFARIYNEVAALPPQEKKLLLSACFFGTFVSLALYLQALKTAHVATLTAISITGPVWVSFIEHSRERKWPNLYLWSAFLFFTCGFLLMTLGTH